MPTMGFDTSGARNDPDLARIKQARQAEERQVALRIEAEKRQGALDRLMLFLAVEEGSEGDLEKLRQAIMDGTLPPQHATIILDQIDSMFGNQDPTARFNSGEGLAVGDDFRDQSGNLFPDILKTKRSLMLINAQQALWTPGDAEDQHSSRLDPDEERRIVQAKRRALAGMLVSAGENDKKNGVTFIGRSIIIFSDKDQQITSQTPIFQVQKNQDQLLIDRIKAESNQSG